MKAPAASGVKNQSNAQGGKSKNPFFHNFFISFHISIYKFFASEKPAFFDRMRKFALLRGTSFLSACGGFRNAMKKSKSLFGRLNNEVRRNFTLRSSRAEDGLADKATAFRTPQGEKRPCRRTHAGQILCVTCAISVKKSVSICVNPRNLWLKINQSKIVNYAKQTQFPKCPNGCNLSKNKEL